MITVRRIKKDDADLLRDIRLCALSDSPTAFSSTYAAEAAFDAQEWRKRAERRSHSENEATFFAFDGNDCCGIIGCFWQVAEPDFATVVSMWVAPQARKKGVGKCLIEAVAQWARQRGLAHLFLDVVSSNNVAIAFYERCGFRLTGESDEYPNDPGLRQLFMLKPL